MRIIINGEEEVLDGDRVTVSDLLRINKVEMPDMVSVQINDEFVKREEFAATSVSEGDSVDFLYFMGGGAR